MSEDDDNIISFRAAAPSATLKTLDWSDKRARCDHRQIEVWAKEPIIECSTCGAVVDPYAWIRERVRDWDRMMDSIEYKKQKAESEMREIARNLRLLRQEYSSEAEKRRGDRAIMIMPARKSVRIEDE